MTTDALTYHLPADVKWRTSRGGLTASASVQTQSRLLHYDFTSNDVRDGALEKLARLSLGEARYLYPDVKRLPDREAGGRPVYVLEATDGDEYYYEFGGSSGSKATTVMFTAQERSAQTDQWIESVLASVVWK